MRLLSHTLLSDALVVSNPASASVWRGASVSRMKRWFLSQEAISVLAPVLAQNSVTLCVCVYLLHNGYQNTHYTSKAGTSLPFPTSSKERLRVRVRPQGLAALLARLGIGYRPHKERTIDRKDGGVYSQLIGGSCPSRHCWEHSPGSLCASWPVPPKPEPGSPSSVLPPPHTAPAHGSFPFRGQPFPHAGSDKSRRQMKALRLTPYAALLDRIAGVYESGSQVM